MKLVFIDTETTNLNPKESSIVQLAGVLVEENGEEHPFSFTSKPYRGESISRSASLKNGLTDEIISKYEDPEVCFKKFTDFLDTYINVEDWNDRAYFVGYNVKFDEDFVREMFNFFGNKNYGRYFFSPSIDVMTLAGFFLMDRRKNMMNFKLTTVYKEIFGVDFENSHNAYADILATRDIYNYILKEYLPTVKVKSEEETVKTLFPVRKKKVIA